MESTKKHNIGLWESLKHLKKTQIRLKGLLKHSQKLPANSLSGGAPRHAPIEYRRHDSHPPCPSNVTEPQRTDCRPTNTRLHGTSNERAESKSRVLEARHAAQHRLSHNCFEGSAHALRLKPMGTEDRAARYSFHEQ